MLILFGKCLSLALVLLLSKTDMKCLNGTIFYGLPSESLMKISLWNFNDPQLVHSIMTGLHTTLSHWSSLYDIKNFSQQAEQLFCCIFA